MSLKAKQETRDLAAVRRLAKRHGWIVRVLTRDDAAGHYENSEAEAPLTDEEWRKLSTSRAWADLDEVSSEDWETLYGAVEEVLGTPAERAERLEPRDEDTPDDDETRIRGAAGFVAVVMPVSLD